MTDEEERTSCPSCGSTEFVQANGDAVCEGCGLVQQRIVSEDAEYRVFSEDSASKNKVRVGAAYNPLMEYSLTERSRLERDEKEFLWDGLKNIEETFYRLLKGDSSNKPVQERAKELFSKAFRMQVAQKQGSVPMKRSGGDAKLKNLNRQKFSRRKQFVVACLLKSLEEHNIQTWSIDELNAQLPGIEVSDYSVNNCLKDLGMKLDRPLPISTLSKLNNEKIEQNEDFE